MTDRHGGADRKDGGPAFPFPFDELRNSSDGMSLRDYLAAKLDTPSAPTKEQVWATTESALERALHPTPALIRAHRDAENGDLK